MFSSLLKLLLHLLLALLLTLLTQIGGLVYLLVIIGIRGKKVEKHLAKKRFLAFSLCYVIATFLLVPWLAPKFGRERIQENEYLEAHSFLYKLANRNYVTPKLNQALAEISQNLNAQHSKPKLTYLDANFPFIKGFPLLPHLSHNDGKKIDICFIYKDVAGKMVNLKPSISGYGVFEAPKPSEYNQITTCESKGYWQYSYAQYLTLGRINKQIEFSTKGTKALSKSILRQKDIRKIFIEPHLKHRLGLQNDKIRYHGCRAVRHDDHIHIQL